MKKLTDNQWRWIWVIGLIILPVTVVHLFDSEIVPRLVSILLLFVLFPTSLVVMVVNPKEKPISLAPRLKDKYSEKTLRRWDFAFKAFAAVAALGIVYYATIPLLSGTYRLAIEQEPTEIIEGTLDNQQSVFGAVFLYWRFNVKETGDELAFFYPNIIRSTGEKYRFTVLPGTNFVLDSEEVR